MHVLASGLMLVSTLSVPCAFITGSALGASDTMSNVSILLIAILAHKGFESFALMIGLYRILKKMKKKLEVFCGRLLS